MPAFRNAGAHGKSLIDARQIVARELDRARRILIITGAGLSADSGLPTYRGLNGLYNGLTQEGVSIESALSGSMLHKRPDVCWRYVAELARGCLEAEPNDGHYAIAALQRRKSECWVLTQNIDSFYRRSGSPVGRLIEIHGHLEFLYCSVCGHSGFSFSKVLAHPLPPHCNRCGGILRPSAVLFEEALPTQALARLVQQINLGFNAVVLVGTTASFPYIVEPVLHTLQHGGFVAEINPAVTELSSSVTIRLQKRAIDVLPIVLSHMVD